MSVKVMSWVFQHSQSTGTDRLVLLAIADSTNDEGCEAWPSLSTLAHKAGIARRSVARCLANLEALGELERVRHGGKAGRGGTSNSYRIVMGYPQKQGHTVPRDGMALGTHGPEVVTTSASSGDEMAPYPSLSIRTIRGDALSPVDNQHGNREQVRKIKQKRRGA